MPTPLGHALTGLAVWAVVRKPVSIRAALTRENVGWAALCVLTANLPDADFISIGAKGVEISGKYHHGITHSIGFAVVMATMAGAWAWGRKKASSLPGAEFAPNPSMAAALTLVCVFSHILLDLFGVDSYPENGIGLPFFWPFSREYFIVPVLSGVDRTQLISLRAVYCVAKEILMCGSLFLLALAYARAKGPRETEAALEAAPARESATE
jgi:membrane-bound metal-dependent hydrolase YbcI (DUF457 family)